MKWKSHRECAKAIAEDLGLDREKMLEGSVYPDKVGKAKSYVRIAKGVSIPVAHSEARICGVAITYPHHKETDQRIRKIMLRLRAEKLKAKELEPFILGCLSHLIQDRVVFPYDHPKFEKFERDIAKYKLKEE